MMKLRLRTHGQDKLLTTAKEILGHKKRRRNVEKDRKEKET